MAKRGWTGRDHTQAFDRLIEKALITIGGLIEGDAALRAPRKTGRLAGSITYATKGEQSGITTPATNRDKIDKPSKKHEAWVGTNVEYAEAVEYGHKRKTSRGGALASLGGRVPAQPYLRPAIDKNRKKAIKILRDALRQEYGKG